MEILLILFMLASLDDETAYIVSEMMDSSSSDSSGPVFSILILYLVFYSYFAMREMQRRGKGRLFWIYPRSSHWWAEVVGQVWVIDVDHRLTRDSYMEYFGMGLDLFERLVPQLEFFMPPPSEWPFARERVPFRKAVAVVLFRLASGASLKICSSKFCIGKSTVVKYIAIIIGILSGSDMLYPCFVGIPRGERLQGIIQGFQEESSIPGIMGAIDGTHIPLRARPDHDQYPADYWCRKGFYSVVLQGICDHRRIFWSLACHIPGSQADSTHLRMSRIWNYLHNEELWLDAPRLQFEGGQTMRPFLVGDAAYPLRPWLMKKFYSHRGPDALTNEFDTSHCAARVAIENTFANLKLKWKICAEMTVELAEVPRVAIACGVLHNFVKLEGVRLRDEDMVPVDVAPRRVVGESRREVGRDIRLALFNHWLRHRVDHMDE